MKMQTMTTLNEDLTYEACIAIQRTLTALSEAAGGASPERLFDRLSVRPLKELLYAWYLQGYMDAREEYENVLPSLTNDLLVP